MFFYMNQKGDEYFLHTIKTKTGIVRYTMKKTADGALAELPEGYEVAENVNGKVSVRKFRPRLINPLEEKLVESTLKTLGLSECHIEIKGKTITIFESDFDSAAFKRDAGVFGSDFAEKLETSFREKLGGESADIFIKRQVETLTKAIVKNQLYSPAFRFTLCEKKHRIFAVQRVSSMGDRGWLYLEEMSLPEALDKYLPHIGKDSFFDLM